MSSQRTEENKTSTPPKLTENSPSPVSEPDKRDRLRDIIVVIIAYPLTPTRRADEVGRKNPWLETLSLVLKAALAAYAIYSGA